ncbi:RICIN domain-containing protein [Streptomyces sp. NBC_01317]|uniref:RICIN domain-containing protein n=1 Tax=Streptomyces sp. NBC_01317 TaxID=2903822 RepID=UPI002E144F3D|nr:RICIN domain-containing protein [Streptomyces sp. NBC_01317]
MERQSRRRRGAAPRLNIIALVFALIGGIWLGTGTAQAASAISPISASGLTLHPLPDQTRAVDGLSANPDLKAQSFADLTGTGTAGKNGLCYPAPFNPGVNADGYCWNNTADDAGTNDWFPQGLSLAHNRTTDGVWGGHHWEVTSWHYGSDNTLAKLRFVDRDATTPRYFDVLLVTAGSGGAFSATNSHVDGVVWYGDNLLVGHGFRLDVYQLPDLKYDSAGFHGFSYLLPARYSYLTASDPSEKGCVPLTGDIPCLNGLSFDRAHGALTSNEFNAGASGGRLIRWPLDLTTGLPATTDGSDFGRSDATAAWSSPVWGMQGAVFAQGSFFISGLCPDSFDTGYRESACVHEGEPGGGTSVLTAVPDMTQNLDWDASARRIHGVNEVGRSNQVMPQRMVFDFAPSAAPLSTVRFKNVNSGKCLLPYHSSLNNGANVIQWDCNGKSPENWYWDGDRIRNFQSNRCLTVYGGSLTQGAQMVQWDCNGSAAQDWTRVTGAAGGGSILVNGISGQCLTVYGGSVDNGADAVQWDCDSTDPAHSWVGSST